MYIKEISEAMQIMTKYAGDDQSFQVEHDEIWVGDDTWPLTDEEKARMNELGFHADRGLGWHAFV